MKTVPIEPNSWYHGCTALDTATGHMLIVVNGHIIIDQVIEEFINSVNQKPKTLEGRLSLFNNFASGMWIQSRQRLTNLNVYASAMTIDEMTDLPMEMGVQRKGTICPGKNWVECDRKY